MMAQSFAAPPMGPGHPGMPHGHPMGVPHPGAAHMGGQPGPMMQGMHPGVAGPQVTQGPMVTGMPPGAGTPAPMQNQMAMAHMTPQQHMFQQQNPQMNLGQQMQLNQQAALMRQKMMMQQQGHGMPMNMQNAPHFNQAQIAQMRMNIPMQQQHHMAQLQANQQQQVQFQQQQQQQRLIAQHAAQQQAAAFQARANQQAAAAQQMQISRSQEPTTQPPQPHPTPAPQNQPAPPQPQPTAPPQPQTPAQPQQAQPQPKPQPQPPPQTNQQGTPQPQVKQDTSDEEPQVQKQEMVAVAGLGMQDIPKQQQNDLTGQCILQLLSYQDNLANPERAEDILYWEEVMQKYFSEYGSIRQQLFNNKMGHDKSFQLQYASLARFYYLHFNQGIKQILMQSFDHNQSKLPNGGIHIWSTKASLTYVFKNDIRITTQGSLKVSFDEMQKIEHLFIATSGWTEYIPRHIIQPSSPEQQKLSPKVNKNQKKNQQKPPGLLPMLPISPVSDFGLPSLVVQFLEIAEVMTAMGPLMDYFHAHPGIGPREALMRINVDNQNQQMQLRAQQNAHAIQMNGQLQQFANQRAMNMPNQFQSPALQHLGLPQGQGSPHMGNPNHTPSPAHNPQGGIAMVHQMSAQGSNLSGSQGPSTNTSPNVSNKKRRQSAVKMEEENPGSDANSNRVKPSPRMSGKRQKGQA